MGRPLKIAKAQAVLVLTATVASTNAVTVSTSLTTAGVIAGMPFVVATSTGNLVAGTTYWVLSVIDATHFTVSATDLSTNRSSTPFPLGNAGPVTVALTVGFVDIYFNNPNGTSNTYSVVGGNTGIYGNQVLSTVAIGIAGAGTIYASTGSALVWGDAGTNLDVNFVAGTAIQAGTANVNGISTDYSTVGFVSSTGNTDVAVANTVITGNIIGVSSSDATNLTVDKPVQFITDIGTLKAGTTYFVKNIANADAFTVSTSIGGPEVQMSANIAATTARQQTAYLAGPASLVNAVGAPYIFSTAEAGYIVRQKGRSKFLVTGTTSGLTGVCYTANVVSAALTPNTMSITATDAGSATIYIERLSDHNADGFGNVTTALPYVVTFNTAQVANANPGQPYPIITVNAA
jgi:hypothetical protein